MCQYKHLEPATCQCRPAAATRGPRQVGTSRARRSAAASHHHAAAAPVAQPHGPSAPPGAPELAAARKPSVGRDLQAGAAQQIEQSRPQPMAWSQLPLSAAVRSASCQPHAIKSRKAVRVHRPAHTAHLCLHQAAAAPRLPCPTGQPGAAPTALPHHTAPGGHAGCELLPCCFWLLRCPRCRLHLLPAQPPPGGPAAAAQPAHDQTGWHSAAAFALPLSAANSRRQRPEARSAPPHGFERQLCAAQPCRCGLPLRRGLRPAAAAAEPPPRGRTLQCGQGGSKGSSIRCTQAANPSSCGAQRQHASIHRGNQPQGNQPQPPV